ncbi:putative reverse transcriptase [Senna tora]|uniref:Putative reverse transcriptase n=1 Tax=Senna tora TaxID=362788 RepID=A0A834WSW5_9FABA|nr:putative reverse transcriptase [Senna tora]
MRRGMTNVMTCSRCGGTYEDVLHAIRDCPRARNLWMRLVRSSHWPEFFSRDLKTWLQLNVSKQLGRLDQDWPSTFATTCWSLWRWRNEAIFGNGDDHTDWFFTVVHRVRNYCEDVKLVHAHQTKNSTRINKVVKWDKPDYGWVKINVDGACCKDQASSAACGGMARNAHGLFIGAFTLHYGLCKVVLEMDSLTARELVRSGVVDSHPCAALIRGIHSRCSTVGEVSFKHVYREGNRVADAMAALAYTSDFSLVFHQSPPGEIVTLLDEDAMGIGSLRSCVV